MWDPTRETGISNDFFLRRIGQFNPLYLTLIVFKLLPLTFIQSYLIFIGCYFMLGLLGYFLVLRSLLNDFVPAFCGFVLLLFSCFTAILFKSFLIFLFTPMIWFAFFLIQFSRYLEKKYFAGLVFTLMVILNTYLPFYFLTIFLIFLMSSFVIFPKEMLFIGGNLLDFAKRNKYLFIVCLGAVVVSLLPGLSLFNAMVNGDYVLPVRQMNEGKNALSVAEQTLALGGMVTGSFWRTIFPDQAVFTLGSFYMPFTGFLLMCCSVVLRVSRLTMFLTLSAVIFILLTVYDASPVYPFLYKHIFYFKYFRNLQFILWIVLFPLLALICAQQLTCCLNFLKEKKSRCYIFLAVFMILTVLPSINIFRNAEKYADVSRRLYPYRYVGPEYLVFKLPDPETALRYKGEVFTDADFIGQDVHYPVVVYLNTKYTYQLIKNINPQILDKYLVGKLILYEKTDEMNNPIDSSFARLITKEDPQVKLTAFDANTLKLKTDFSSNQFLVYNDSYDAQWRAFVDNKQVPLFRSNIAFKGIHIPAGQHEIVFQYRRPIDYLNVYLIHAVFIGMFLYLMRLWFFRNCLHEKANL